MSFQNSLPLTTSTRTPPTTNKQFTRPSSAGYHPSIWGDRFLVYASDSQEVEKKLKQKSDELREEVRKMLTAPSSVTNKPMQKLSLIDAIQRLGVSYHFEPEIEEALQVINNSNIVETNSYDLHIVSLWFRLLRQQGYNVSSDVFKRFQDSEGNFKASLVNDVKGMLSLYEAAHFRIHGEEILENALVFTTANLSSMMTCLEPPLAAQVSHALKHSIRKNVPRLEARTYISFYENDPSHNQIVLNFAKLDFNMLQKQYRKELSITSTWWKKLDVPGNLPFVRDRLVETYFWMLGVYYEPQFSLARNISHKVISLLSITDDIYDSYGTLDELQLYADAIERWDISCIDQLPEYMKVLYKAVLELYREIEEVMNKEGRSYCTDYFKEAMKRLVRTYYKEAIWRQEKYVPTMEEYMDIALVSCGYFMLTITSFICMRGFVTKEALDWAMSYPKMVRAAAAICRLMDDIVSTEFEQERGHVASGIECYMKQYGVSEEYVYGEFRKQVEDAWKDINLGCIRPTVFPMPLLSRIANLARVIDTLYQEIDGYTHAQGKTKGYIESILINPINID